VWLIIAACLWAATLQTHSSAVIYILVAGIYVLSPRFRSEAQLTAGWYLGSLMAFLAAYSNMIYYNIISGWGSFSWVGQKGYALETDFGIRSFLQNLAEMSVELLRTLSSTYSGHANLWQYFLHPLFVLSLVVLVIGIRQAFKQREYLLFSFIAAGFAVIPWINQRYTFFLATRYIMPQVICSIILVAAALVSAWNKYRCRIRYPRLITNIAAVMIIMAICLQPWPFYNYCRQASKTNESNRSALQVMSIVRSASAEKVLILLDGELPLPNRPLPVLMALSRHNYAMLPGLSGSANIVTADLYKALEQSMDSEVIAVLSQSSYNRLKSKLPVAETYALSTIVTIPKPSVVPDTIYIIKLIRPNSELTSTGKTN
jgi:hypothetical protein